MIYGVSHGEAVAGIDDPGLSDRGKMQAAAAGDMIRECMAASENDPLVIASPMARAQETAEQLGFGYRTDDRLAELSMGLKIPDSPFALIDLGRVATVMPFRGYYTHTAEHDSWYQAAEKACEVVDENYEECKKDNRPLVIVTHRGILRGMSRYLHPGILSHIPGAGVIEVGQLVVEAKIMEHGLVGVIDDEGFRPLTARQYANHQ